MTESGVILPASALRTPRLQPPPIANVENLVVFEFMMIEAPENIIGGIPDTTIVNAV